MPKNSPLDLTTCPIRLKLSNAVSKAIRENFAAKSARDHAAANKEDRGQFILALAKARNAEREAITALNKHRMEHGC